MADYSLAPSPGADRWNNGNLVPLPDLPVCIVGYVHILQVHCQRTAAQHLLLDALVPVFKHREEAADLHWRRQVLARLARKRRSGGKVED